MRALTVALGVALVALASASGAAPAKKKCAPDAVAAGPDCVDRFEASVWSGPGGVALDAALVKKIQKGAARLEDLERAGAVQLGCDENGEPDFPESFPADGDWQPLPGSDPPHPGVYAVSVEGAPPTTCISWLQADQACTLVGKRLLDDATWTRTAAGTPDAGDDDHMASCRLLDFGPSGVRSDCVSVFGATDMIGNASEWTSEWSDLNPKECLQGAADDLLCFGGDGGTMLAGALARGGSSSDFTGGGFFAAKTTLGPDQQAKDVGFRCMR